MMQDVSASTTGLQALKQVRSLRVEHATVTCLPPGITCLELVRCRLVASPRLMEGNTLASLTLDSCSGHVRATYRAATMPPLPGLH